MNEPAPPSIDFDSLPPIPATGRPWAAEWSIAWAHLRSKKQEGFVSLVTILSIVGVIAGVATLNIVLSVMTGFELDLRDKILGANAHIVLLRNSGTVLEPAKRREEVLSVDGVEAASPFMYYELMIRSNWSSTGCILKGIDPDLTPAVTSLRRDLKQDCAGEIATDAGKDALFQAMKSPIAPPPPPPAPPPKPGDPSSVGGPDFDPPDADPLPGILLGNELAKQLQVVPCDRVQIIDPLGGSIGPMGMPTPRVKQFRVAGIYSSGMFEYDTKWSYAANKDVQDFLKLGDAVTGLEIKVDDIDDVERISAEINDKVGFPYYTRHWKELNQALFKALELEKVVMGLILFLIVANAALLIITTLIMMVLTKGREIAILKAMGASNRSILRIFVIEGSAIGLVGTVAGTALGLAGCRFLDWYGYPLETDVYFLSRLPVVVEWDNVVIIAIAAFLTCFVATLYPAWRASSVDPVEGLRYE